MELAKPGGIWHFFLVATSSSRKKRKKPAGNKPYVRKKETPTSAQKLELLEELVSILLQASLRGRLLPSERKPIKEYLQSRKASRRKEGRIEAEFRCPACRSPLANRRASRCPWCSVLLTESVKKRRSKR